MSSSMPKVIGVVTAGGDCPGLNAVIRAVVKTAIGQYQMQVYGVEDGFQGFIENRLRKFCDADVSGILTQGGTILGTSNRHNPFRFPRKACDETVFEDRSDEGIANMEAFGIEALVCIGGDGTLSIAKELKDKGASVVGVPKTIDNDLAETDVTFGFDSAVSVATDAVDRLHTTAQSHHRVMVIEVMGRYAGWLALGAGVAGGGDVILIPEIPYRLEKICKRLWEREQQGKRFSIVVVAEGAKAEGGELVVKKVVKDSPETLRLGGVGKVVADQIEDTMGVETRVTVLGHLVRGGSPTAFDRILATRFGNEAVNLVAQRDFGKMVAIRGQEIVSVEIEKAVKEQRLVPPDSPLVRTARAVGSSFGD